MDKDIKDKLMALPPDRRLKVIQAAASVVARRVKRNNRLLMENMRSQVKQTPKTERAATTDKQAR